MSGIFESWMHKLVSAVMQREREANVVVVDWLPMAQQVYVDAVNHTHTVGLDLAALLDWLQVCDGAAAAACWGAEGGAAAAAPELFAHVTDLPKHVWRGATVC